MQVMTFSNRRRLAFLLRELIFNSGSFIAFILGFLLSFLIITSTLLTSVNQLDKAGLSICVSPTLEKFK